MVYPRSMAKELGNDLPVRGKIWLSTPSAAGILRAVRADPRKCEYLVGNDGFYISGRGLILISSELVQTAAEYTFMHELFHGNWDAPGDEPMFAKLFDCSPRQAGQIEEHVATVLGPRTAASLIGGGFLKFPPLPEMAGRLKTF